MLVCYHKAEQYNNHYEHLYKNLAWILEQKSRLAESESGTDVLNCALSIIIS